jgi:hypothetical protein
VHGSGWQQAQHEEGLAGILIVGAREVRGGQRWLCDDEIIDGLDGGGAGWLAVGDLNRKLTDGHNASSRFSVACQLRFGGSPRG